MPELELSDFLDKKGEEYAPFDPDRFRNFINTARDKLQHINPKIVQIVGTNGKGSTGRFLATMLVSGGFRTAHFTSPHVVSVAERFWLNGVDSGYEELSSAHLELSAMFGEGLDGLSYFEYLTLLGYYHLGSRSDILILEAGVGGEYDSTNGFAKELLLVTKISKDHIEMLGDTVYEIARTKLAASNCKTVVAKQEFACEVESAAKALGISYNRVADLVDKNEMDTILGHAKECGFASYLVENLLTAYAGAKHFLQSPNIKAALPPRYRFFRYKKNIILDVGHNVDAAKAIRGELEGGKVTLVFNSYADKNPEHSLEVLKPVLRNVLILPIDSKRAIKKEKLIEILDKIEIEFGDFEDIDESRNYLVFGSFAVVAEFLRRGF